jgi:hypothetical protein
MNNLSLGQRLMADTPKFFKIAGLIGTILVIAAASMAYFHVPVAATAAVGALGTGIVTLSPFAVNDVATITSAPSLISGVAELIPQLIEQIGQVKTAIANPAPVSLSADATALLTQVATLNAAPAPAPQPAVQSQPGAPAAGGTPSLSAGAEELLNNATGAKVVDMTNQPPA